jgi:serine/threonine protein kinase
MIASATPDDNDPLIGLEIDDYRLTSKIGQGGMGVVYAAEDLALNRRVAVKLLPRAVVDRQLRERFEREMRHAAAIEHPNIVPVFRAGLAHDFLYIAMSFVNGPDLRRVLMGARPPLERSLKLFEGVAAAVAFMHDERYVHRDIKPANILVRHAGTPTEWPLLTDLGIARALDDPRSITRGRPPGTPVYMAPETFLHWVAEAPADQYALACVLFEMVAGRPPFVADNVAEVERLHTDEPAPRVTDFCVVPDGVAVALERALSKDPAARYESIGAFSAAVLEGASEDRVAPPPPPPPEPPERKLTPASVSLALFAVSPDRDEKASQLAAETFLTLQANGYAAPDGDLASPKRRNGAVRSLAIGENFLEGFEQEVGANFTVAALGERLARGQDFLGSDGLGLAQEALGALVDERTRQGSAGATLLLPFHESLLWYDARKSGATIPWSVRKVNMRGTGVTLARVLLDPPAYIGEPDRSAAGAAVDGIKGALQAPSPFAELAKRLNSAVPPALEQRDTEPDERDSWAAADNPLLEPLARSIIRHCANIAAQRHAAPSTQLLQIRAVLALDVIAHALRTSWRAVDTPEDQRFLLLAYTPEPRRMNRVRIASEGSYQLARQKITQAMIATLARRASELAAEHSNLDWDAQFEPRSKLAEVVEALPHAVTDDEYLRLGRLAFESASGGGYNRPVDAFRVLLESVELLLGTGQYRFLQAGPEVLGAMVGAVGGTPMPSDVFLSRVAEEWGFVIGEAEMIETTLVQTLDGSQLSRNSRHCEQLLVNAGLAIALSDQTCMVGQRTEEAT